MTVLCDWLGDDFPTFPQFVRMLREYERRPVANDTRRPDPAAGFYTPSGWRPADAAYRAYCAQWRQHVDAK